MIGIYFFTAAILTLVWGILCGSFSIITLLTGLAISICCILFARKYLPLYKLTDTNPLKLLIFPFYLIGQMYLSALSNIMMILTDSHADYVTVKTRLKSNFLKVLLAHSVTLTPGTVALDLHDDNLTVLYLTSRSNTGEDNNIRQSTNAAEKNIKKMEKRLLKAQK